MKFKLIEDVIELLEEDNFRVSECRGIKSCFDIMASGKVLLLIKVLTNIEGLTCRSATELKQVADSISAVPLLIGDRMKSSRLLDGVLYVRYNIPLVSVLTMREILQEMMPLIYSIRGNYCVDINPEKLIQVRHKFGMSLHELANELGVSKQSVYRYERSGRISMEIATRIIELFGDEILISRVSWDRMEVEAEMPEFEGYLTDLKREVIREFNNIGFSTSLMNAPFDVLAKEKKWEYGSGKVTKKMEKEQKLVFAIVSNNTEVLKRRVSIVREISEITGGYEICVSERRLDIDSMVMKPDELREFRDPRELMELLSNF